LQFQKQLKNIIHKMTELGSFDIARKTLYWGIAGFVLSILVLALVIYLSLYNVDLTKTPAKLEAKILSSRFLYPSKCFAYQDPITERTHPRLIDLSRFKNETLADCYLSDTTKDHQFQLKLKNLDNNQTYQIQTKEWFNVPSFTIREPVFIKQDGTISNGQLLIIVQKPI